MTEEWRPVRLFEGFYEVSSLGRVRRVAGYRNTFDGRVLSTGSNARYFRIILSKANKIKHASVHRLVCEAFHGPQPSPAHIVAHNNGDRHDNRACNVRWATPLENSADMRRHGTVPMGDTSAVARLRSADIPVIRARLAKGESQMSIARSLNVSGHAIWCVAHNVTWRHIA